MLRQDMPGALHRVETAATLLQQASDMLRTDPYSGPARSVITFDFMLINSGFYISAYSAKNFNFLEIW